jgi:hypothetical protein
MSEAETAYRMLCAWALRPGRDTTRPLVWAKLTAVMNDVWKPLTLAERRTCAEIQAPVSDDEDTPCPSSPA